MSASERERRLADGAVGWLPRVLACSALACGGGSDGAPAALPEPLPNAPAGAGSLAAPIELELVAEKKLSRVFDDSDIEHFEASGVVARDGTLFVAADNLQRIGAIGVALGSGSWGPGAIADSQYEAITSSDDGRFFLVVESAAGARARIVTLDASTALASESLTDVSFGAESDGFEGLAWVRSAGVEYLLALCENNACWSGDTSPGHGLVQLLSLVDGVWSSERRLELPPEVRFRNYSDLALLPKGDGSFVAAIVSRQSSALWLGRLTLEPWAFSGPGTFYTFPRGPSGEVEYCTLEGVTFLDARRLALVSDKSDGEAPCNRKDESVHIFDLPAARP